MHSQYLQAIRTDSTSDKLSSESHESIVSSRLPHNSDKAIT